MRALTQEERTDILSDLFSKRDKKNDPKIGFFWYHPKFGLFKEKGDTTSPFVGDYTQLPRGRIYKTKGKSGGIKIVTGKWILDYPEAKDLILDEFDLCGVKHEWVYDQHWDVGHGWSE